MSEQEKQFVNLDEEEERKARDKMGKAEKDPFGKDAYEPGSKLDMGKTRLGLVLLGFAAALEEVGKVGTYGAAKYTDEGWVSVPKGRERYTDALLRHLLTEPIEEKDKDSGLRHSAHVAWNALARLQLEILGQ